MRLRYPSIPTTVSTTMGSRSGADVRALMIPRSSRTLPGRCCPPIRSTAGAIDPGSSRGCHRILEPESERAPGALPKRSGWFPDGLRSWSSRSLSATRSPNRYGSRESSSGRESSDPALQAMVIRERCVFGNFYGMIHGGELSQNTRENEDAGRTANPAFAEEHPINTITDQFTYVNSPAR